MALGVDRLLYRHAGPLLVRATTHPDGLALPECPDLSGAPDAVVEHGSAWLARVWAREDVRKAVQVASPVLSQQVQEVAVGRRPDARHVRRLVHSVASYLLRWQGRATPFGLFAGVGAAQAGGEPFVRWGQAHRVVARADAEWLGGVVGRLERHTGLLERLPVVANGSAFVRGDWLVVAGLPPDGHPGGFAPLEVSVRHTGPVRAAVEAAREPIRFGDLVKQLAVAYPNAATEQISTMLAQLVAKHVLLTGLRSPMSVPDALGHLCAQLEAAGADEIPDLAGLVRQLQAVRDELSRHNATTSPAAVGTIRTTVAERMRAVCDAAPQPLLVDVSLDCEIAVPAAVIREAEAAACALLRLTPYPFGSPRWKDFHSRFRQRYGIGAAVTVHDLLLDSGLELPAGYLGSPLEPAARTLTKRDEFLLTLAQQTMIDGGEEIVLTEPLIQQLTVGDLAEMLPPSRVELAFQIHAASPDALRRGAFRLVVTGVPRPGSSMAGRFVDLLPASERTRWADAYAAPDAEDPDSIAVQLSFPPRQRRTENVVRAPQLLTRTISLSEYRDPHGDLIEFGDLGVCADARQLYLVQMSTGRRVEPRVLHALEAGQFTPPIVRFLAEITTARCAVYKGFDWGAAVRLPYLPRVRYGRTVLSAARWLLAAADLPARSAPLSDWEAALGAWRRRLRVPSAVVLCESDLRLPLNLDHGLHRSLLRARLHRAHQVELHEAPTGADLAWMGRAHEVLMPLHLADAQTAARLPGPVSRPRMVARDAGYLPGRSAWLYAQIHGHPDRQNDILTDHLPRLLDGWDEALLWWFNRHRDLAHLDLAQHLNVYMRLPSPDRYGAAATRVGDWAADMRERGLVPHIQLATYHPDTGRYGHGPAQAAAVAAFAADSAAALAQITFANHTGTPPEAVTAASLVDLATSYTDTPEGGLRWLIDQLPHEQGRVDQTLRDAALRLADPGDDWATLHAQPAGATVVVAWQRRRIALSAYRETLTHQRDPHPVLRSLLHQHHVRAIGVDPDRERITHRLARAAALRHTAHHRRGTR